MSSTQPLPLLLFTFFDSLVEYSITESKKLALCGLSAFCGGTKIASELKVCLWGVWWLFGFRPEFCFGLFFVQEHWFVCSEIFSLKLSP